MAKGLGRGLDAFFGDDDAATIEKVTKKSTEKQDDNVIEKVVELNITEVEPMLNQPRKVFDKEKMEELTDSIRENGVIQPILVVKDKNGYTIVAGERRWRAAKKAGLTELPVIVRDYDEKQNSEIALIENIQRKDLNPIEKARGIKKLMEDYNFTQQEVADKLGFSRSAIANTVRILNLDERVIQLALEGKLTEGHCRALMAIQDNDKQYTMALHMIENGSSVRDAENKMKVRKNMKKKDEKYEAIYRDIEDSFRGFFGTKVKVDAKQRSGKIIIEYSSNDDLERILGLIK